MLEHPLCDINALAVAHAHTYSQKILQQHPLKNGLKQQVSANVMSENI